MNKEFHKNFKVFYKIYKQDKLKINAIKIIFIQNLEN